MNENIIIMCPICGHELNYTNIDETHKMVCSNCGMTTGSCTIEKDLYKCMEKFVKPQRGVL
jgi:DNA-directed RNA polymerase subunit RPC12/RpoP